MNQGKFVIIGMVLLGVSAAAAAWIHRYYETDEVRERFGAHAVKLIAGSSQATAICRLGDKETKRADVSKAKGFSNIRYMLGRDFAYRFGASPVQPPLILPAPSWALEFCDGDDCVLMRFSYNCQVIFRDDQGRVTSAELVDAAAAELRTFFNEQFADEATSSDGSGLRGH
jgi:hypothetical protein